MLKRRGFKDSPLEAILISALVFSKAISRGSMHSIPLCAMKDPILVNSREVACQLLISIP
jgi:hypothetical protein